MVIGGRLRRQPLAVAVILAIGLAGCGSESTPTAQTSASPSTARPTAAASRSIAPTPSPDPGREAMTKFFALVTDKAFAYQATFTGESRYSVSLLSISKGLLQVSGRDVRVQATFFDPSTGARALVEHRYVGGRAWIRFAPLAWRRLASFDAGDSMAAFAAVHAPPDVAYGGPVNVAGKTLYKVTMKSVIVNPIMNPFSNLTDTAVTSSKLAVLIDSAGRPISGTALITGRGRISGQLQENLIDLELAFTKVGAKVTISAP